MSDNISVLLVDDHAMLRKGMALLLGEEADIEVIGEADDGSRFLVVVNLIQNCRASITNGHCAAWRELS